MGLSALVTGEKRLRSAERAGTWKVAGLAALLAFICFVTTLQTEINGSAHPYTTDVGEIQNALPRWGTIHFTGYPLYTALGSLTVNALRLLGIPPAAGASLYSALWGALAIGLLAWLLLELKVAPALAVVASLLFALSTSLWVDASLAELHTMTMALTFAGLLAALRFYRQGRRRDFYWLAFIVGQGLAHQRAFVFSVPAMALLALPHWRVMLRHWLPALGLALLGPLTYLYLPLVDWLGSDWVFSNPGTWDGFWALVMDTKTERIIELPGTVAELWTRVRGVAGVLSDDLPWPLWLAGLLALTFLGRTLTLLERLALALSWVPFFLLSVVIWVGFVGDALLAAKLPVIAMSAVGLGLLGQAVWRWRRSAGRMAVAGGLILAATLFQAHRPTVLAITRDPSAAETIDLADQIPPPGDGRPATLMALWGNDFWQLAYAHRFEGRFPHLNLVDHNADFSAIVARGDHLYTLSRTFYERPLEWWEQRLGAVSLSSVAYRVVEIRPRDAVVEVEGGPLQLLDNGIVVQDAALRWVEEDELLLRVVWRASSPTDTDYSVAVHLVSSVPPAGPDDIVDQADSAHPVYGWYPTTEWRRNEVVQGHYRLEVPQGDEPVAVRLGMYRVTAEGEFENAGWLTVPVPAS